MKKLILLLSVIIQSCANSTANGTASAEAVASPLEGYQCFVIKDSSGEVKGGNCVKN